MKNWLIGGICLLVIVVLTSCGTDTLFTAGGTYDYGATRYGISKARFEYQGDVYQNDVPVTQLTFSDASLNVNETGISGYGALVNLKLIVPDGGVNGDYVVSTSFVTGSIVADSSQFVYYQQDKLDTLYVGITGGYLNIDDDALGKRFSFHFLTSSGDSLVGSYVGSSVYNTIVDGDSVGYVLVDTLQYALQKGDLYCWGDLFTPDVYYYEFYLYSTNLRYRDNGLYSSGYYLVLGLQSENSNGLSDGVYPISSYYEGNTSLYGNRMGNVNWGCFWQTFDNGSVSGRANILADSLVLSSQADGSYRFSISMKDQLGNSVVGEYNSTFVEHYVSMDSISTKKLLK